MNNDEFMDFEDEENDDLIELVDDNGESVTFEHLATLTYKGETYLALADPEAEDPEGLEVIIMKIDQDEVGSDIYTAPEDDVADAVFNEFMKMMDDTDSTGEN